MADDNPIQSELFPQGQEAAKCKACRESPPLVGRKMCEPCRAKAAERSAGDRAKRKAAGCCGQCGTPRQDGRACPKCVAYYKTRPRKPTKRKKRPAPRFHDDGSPVKFCNQCCKEFTTKGTYCEPCKARQKELVADRVAAGGCFTCAKFPAAPGGRRCVRCRDRFAAYMATRRVAKREKNECAVCLRPALEGMSMCLYHLEAERRAYHEKPKAPRPARNCRVCGGGPVLFWKRICAPCKTAQRKASHERRQKVAKETGLCRTCGKPKDGDRIDCAACRESARARRERIKMKCMLYYGGRCKRCGITDLRVLTIDHVNNDGAEFRKSGIVRGALLQNAGIPRNWTGLHETDCSSIDKNGRPLYTSRELT